MGLRQIPIFGLRHFLCLVSSGRGGGGAFARAPNDHPSPPEGSLRSGTDGIGMGAFAVGHLPLRCPEHVDHTVAHRQCPVLMPRPKLLMSCRCLHKGQPVPFKRGRLLKVSISAPTQGPPPPHTHCLSAGMLLNRPPLDATSSNNP